MFKAVARATRNEACGSSSLKFVPSHELRDCGGTGVGTCRVCVVIGCIGPGTWHIDGPGSPLDQPQQETGAQLYEDVEACVLVIRTELNYSWIEVSREVCRLSLFGAAIKKKRSF